MVYEGTLAEDVASVAVSDVSDVAVDGCAGFVAGVGFSYKPVRARKMLAPAALRWEGCRMVKQQHDAGEAC